MPETFFEPGKRSHCLFAPDQWCDVFNPSSPFAPFDFLCEVEPQLVTAALPGSGGEGGEDGEVWDRVFETIKRVWQDRQVGFRCQRIDAGAWAEERPCAACGMVRKAQVVVLDLHGGDKRAACYREMAGASSNSLQILKAFHGEAPNKRVILISSGPCDLPPFYQKLFDWIDYTGADGRPDFDKLASEMEKIARQGLFAAGDVLRFGPEVFLDPPVEAAAQETAAAGSGDGGGQDQDQVQDQEQEGDWQNDIRFLGVSPVADLEPLPKTAQQRRAERIAEAKRLVDLRQHAGALRILAQDLDGARSAELRELERACVAAMAARDLAAIYFNGLTGRDRHRLQLSDWPDDPLAAATLRSADLRPFFDASEVLLYASDDLAPKAADELIRHLASGPPQARPALAVIGNCGEEARQGLAALRTQKVVTIHLEDLRRWLLERKAPLDSLRDRSRADYRRQDDQFLCGIHLPSWEEGAFFGRDQLAAHLLGRLREGDSFALFGLPYTGKTSLLWRLARQATQNGDMVAIVDLAGHAGERPADVYARTVRAVREAVAAGAQPEGDARPLDLAKIGALFTLATSSPVEAFRGRFEVDLRALVETIRRQADRSQARLILLFDEAETCLTGEHRLFFAQLQSLTKDGACALGLSGMGFSLRKELGDRACPLRGIREHYLPSLDDAACSRMISTIGQRMYRSFTPEATAQIARQTGGQPLLLRYLCSLTLEAIPDGGDGTVGQEDVQRGALRALATDDLRRRLARIFGEIEDRLKIGAHLLKLLAGPADDRTTEEGMQVAQLRRRTSFDAAALEHDLKMLASYGLIATDIDRCRHRVGLLSSWLWQRSRIER